jgi:hypothetical protein
MNNLPGISKHSDPPTVPASPLVNAWMGSTHIFGLNTDGPVPVYQSGESITPATPFGSKLRLLKHRIPSKSFNTQAELFLEGDDGAHDACRSALITLEKPMEIQAWHALYMQLGAKILCSATDTKNLVMGLRFSGTPPPCLPGWSNDQLPPSHLACAWKGAQLAFGSTWIKTVQSPVPALQLPTTTAISGPSASVSLTSQTSMSPTDQSEPTAQTSVSSVSSVSFSAPTKLASALKNPLVLPSSLAQRKVNLQPAPLPPPDSAKFPPTIVLLVPNRLQYPVQNV